MSELRYCFITQGMYVEFLGDWLRVFPRQQLLILRNEDYKVAQRQHMEAVFKFLGALRDYRSTNVGSSC